MITNSKKMVYISIIIFFQGKGFGFFNSQFTFISRDNELQSNTYSISFCTDDRTGRWHCKLSEYSCWWYYITIIWTISINHRRMGHGFRFLLLLFLYYPLFKIFIIIRFSSFDNISRRHASWIIRVFCVHSFSTDTV